MTDQGLDDEAFLAALREPCRNRLSVFDAALQEHRGHPTFRHQDWAFSREVGFTCFCDGTEREWRIGLRSLKEMVPDARDVFLQMRERHLNIGRGKDRRKAWRAQRKAKALLHQFLTRPQRWDLRASKSFEIVGQDSFTYRITEGSCNNVHRIEPDGTHLWSLCLVTTGPRIPTYDLMLTQKLLLETDIQRFLKTAHVQNQQTKDVFPSGDFLFQGTEPPECKRRTWTPLLTDLPDEVLDDPAEWVLERVAG